VVGDVVGVVVGVVVGDVVGDVPGVMAPGLLGPPVLGIPSSSGVEMVPVQANTPAAIAVNTPNRRNFSFIEEVLSEQTSVPTLAYGKRLSRPPWLRRLTAALDQ
jgi:hypothetical protein